MGELGWQLDEGLRAEAGIRRHSDAILLSDLDKVWLHEIGVVLDLQSGERMPRICDDIVDRLCLDVSGKGVTNGHFSDAVDEVTGKDGRQYKSNQATIWRWRDAFQNDFAARMQWTLSPELGKGNHHPVVDINGNTGLEPVHIELEAGSSFQLDASASYDPDPNDSLTFKWYQYRDPSATQWSVQYEVGLLDIKSVNEAGSIVVVTLPPPEKCCVELISRKAMRQGQLLHLILEVKDNGSPALITYRRVIIQATNEKLLGGGGGTDAIGDTMRDLIHQ